MHDCLLQLGTKKIGAKDVYMTESSDYNGRNFSYNLIYVSWNFLRTMGIHIVDGRDFTEADARSDRPAFIFNDYARRSLQISVGPFKYWRDNLGDLVGFTGDLHIALLRQESTNICLAASPLGSRLFVSYIRLKSGTDVRAATAHIRKTVAAIDPSFPIDITFYDTIYDELYHRETTLRTLITFFWSAGRVTYLALWCLTASTVGRRSASAKFSDRLPDKFLSYSIALTCVLSLFALS